MRTMLFSSTQACGHLLFGTFIERRIAGPSAESAAGAEAGQFSERRDRARRPQRIYVRAWRQLQQQ